MIAFQIAKEMKRRRLTKSEMASLMKTSRPALRRARQLSQQQLAEELGDALNPLVKMDLLVPANRLEEARALIPTAEIAIV